MEWRPIETAPKSDPWYEAKRVLVYGPETGVQPGKVWVREDGTRKGSAEGFNGNYEITHWMPIPAPPTS